ncbi:ORF6N domain-containing protein [Legionella spiritensis]|uniref:ORF6N domain-containing protein n=1 Tax=Legionella spiritensis TaxID=452 RepID=UPI0018D50FBC
MNLAGNGEHRFPADFMFQVTKEEHDTLKSQIVTLDKRARGKHRKFCLMCFRAKCVICTN